MFARINAALTRAFAAHSSQDEGQAMAEYGLILALIAVVVIGAVTLIGTNLDLTFSSIAGQL